MTDSQKSAAAWAAIVALCVLTLWLLAPVLAPFVVAAVLAYGEGLQAHARAAEMRLE